MTLTTLLGYADPATEFSTRRNHLKRFFRISRKGIDDANMGVVQYKLPLLCGRRLYGKQ